MSDSSASLRHKIDSAGELQSVVRTMKALAASSIGQYEKAVHALGDYFHTVELGLGMCFRQAGPMGLNTHDSGANKSTAIGAIVFGSDQGLVGQFNEVIVAHALQTLTKTTKPMVWVLGERANARLVDAGLSLAGKFGVANSVQSIASLVGQILVAVDTDHGQGRLTELYLFYNRPTADAGYEPVTQRLLPLDAQWQRKLMTQPWPGNNLPEVLGDLTATLRALIREYLFISLFRACAESLASENASRLAAMQRAEKNIDELLTQLRNSAHRIRQSSIDEELFDVISGFEALSDQSRASVNVLVHPRN